MLERSTLEADFAEDDAAGAPLRLLVVDDDDVHRLIICRVAAKAGFVPAGAASYDEAAALSRDTVFDCITLDLSLGAHAGVEMLRHLSNINYKGPIVIISGCDYATCRETLEVGKALKLNVGEPVPKPVDLAELRFLLERVKSQRSSTPDRLAS